MASKIRSKVKKKATNAIRFRAHAPIGFAAAEEDREFLDHCFIDTGFREAACQTDSPYSIVLGRTGSGKSALLMHIERYVENPIRVSPENLALSYISNSTIIDFFEELGLNLDIFYRTLWMHVFCVELLNYYFFTKKRNSIDTARQWLAKASDLSGKRRKAIEYCTRWNSTFWAETEARVKEITRNLEESLEAEAGVSHDILRLGAKGTLSLSEEQKIEIISSARHVVEGVQIQQLAEVMKIINDDIFSQQNEGYYVIIDGLDEDWVSEKRKYFLIRALIETIKKFRTIRNVKILISLRKDLMERVYTLTADKGFQREKYKGLELELKWNKEDLYRLVRVRINYLMKKQYTKSNVDYYDIFPNKIFDKLSFEYMAARTLGRPRDIIAFVNQCLHEAEGKTEITQRMVLDAERTYSAERMEALCFEWRADHPALSSYFKFISMGMERFEPTSFSDDYVREIAEKIYLEEHDKDDALIRLSEGIVEQRVKLSQMIAHTLLVLHKVGAIGIKASTAKPFEFSILGEEFFNDHNFPFDSKIQVHPMLWRALGVSARGSIG